MGQNTRAKVNKEIFKRLKPENFDKVACCRSSNGNENFYSVLVKHTCGKRIFFGKKDVWYVKSIFVAAKMSNDRITDDVRAAMGVTVSPLVRENAIEADLNTKSYLKEYKSKDKYKTRRKQANLMSKIALQKNMRDPARHKTEKMSPKDNCKSTGKAKKER